MNSFVVITSIFEPTEAVQAFAKLSDHQLVVVGDKKTPENWSCEGATYLSVADQQATDFEIARVLPYNHYCRKMVGYLHAIQAGADCIIDTDDDNIPKDNWVFPALTGNFERIQGDQGFINVYQLYTPAPIWPRGLPLRMITTQFDLESKLSPAECKVGIWQGLADEDPDVDAIYRLTSDTLVNFASRPPLVVGKGTISPFNTQNTLVRKELFPLMYLPTYVTFRFTDILRGFIAQPIMWLYGYELGFLDATVVQKRNPHDYMKDFVSEIPMYLHTERVMELVGSAISASESIESNLHLAYEALLAEGIVTDQEMVTLDAWLKDISRLSS